MVNSKFVKPHNFAEIEVYKIPFLVDNFGYVIRNKGSREIAIVDPGVPDKFIAFCDSNGWRPRLILLTHEHDDHSGGVQSILETYEACRLVASRSTYENLTNSSNYDFIEALEGKMSVNGYSFEVMHSPGHTDGHVIYRFCDDECLFSGDVIFGLGSGRVISGSIEDHFLTFQKLRKLPRSTLVFCAHEYTLKNLTFLREWLPKIKPGLLDDIGVLQTELDKMEGSVRERISLEAGTVPLNLGFELDFNPYFRVRNLNEFTTLRSLRDLF